VYVLPLVRPCAAYGLNLITNTFIPVSRNAFGKALYKV
jgi:hypothetical protein